LDKKEPVRDEESNLGFCGRPVRGRLEMTMMYVEGRREELELRALVLD